MTDEELSAIEALANAATQGPWEWVAEDTDRMSLEGLYRTTNGEIIKTDVINARLDCTGYEGYFSSLEVEDKDRAFIAASREAVPALIAEVRRLRAANANLQKDVEYAEREWRKEACLLTQEIQELRNER